MQASNDELKAVLRQPIPLTPNRVYRFYKGGALIDRFRGASDMRDTDYPEDWVGSITPANNPGEGHPPDEGLSRVTLPSGAQTTLKALLERFPEELLGTHHVARYGASSGLLVKLLDSSIRLPIHCHPTRPFARRHFSSIFGKTEAWIVVETRPSSGVEPYVMLGFKEGVEKQTFRRQVERQEIADMKAGLHRVPVKPGDIFYVKAGLPHAIGEGVFLIEAQEPTDFSIVAEWQDFPIDPRDAHLGLGWDVAIDCFDFTNYRPQQVLDEYKLEPQLLHESRGGEEWQLLGGKTADYFRATRLVVHGEVPIDTAGFYIGIVTSGSGALAGEFVEIELRQSDSFVCSATVPAHAFRATGERRLEIVRCLPPE
jgi:mannose-6-phosphate isomerase